LSSPDQRPAASDDVRGAEHPVPPSPAKPRHRTRRERRQRPPGPSRLIETAGPDPGTPLAEVRLTVGRIVGTHGVRGELKVRLTTDEPDHLTQIKRLWVGEERNPRRVLGVRFHAGFGLIRLKGISTPEIGDEFRGQTLQMAGTDARPLEPGEFYLYQLIGLAVFDEAGQSLGTVVDVIETGANDVLVVAPPDGGPEQLFPHHPDVVLDVRPDLGRMTVRPLVYND
jgi:16S rRNA processing protein RimM